MAKKKKLNNSVGFIQYTTNEPSTVCVRVDHDTVWGLTGLLFSLISFTLPISFFHALVVRTPCETNGRYLPATYMFCKLAEPLEQK